MAGFNRDPNVTQIEHVYAICYRPEVAGDVFFGDNVKAFEGYAVLNFEVSAFSSFRHIKKIISWRRRRRTSTITLRENDGRPA